MSKPQVTWRVDTIGIEKVVPNKNQPRERFDRERLEELRESIEGAGQVELILTRELPNGNVEILSGHRRFQEQIKSGAKEVTVLIKTGLDEKRSALEAFISNECRENLDAEERYKAVRKIQKLYGLKEDQITETAVLLGMTTYTLNSILVFKKIQPVVQDKVRRHILKQDTVTVLTRLDDAKDQIKASEIVEKHKLTRDQTRAVVKAINVAPAPLKKAILDGKVDPMEAVKAAEVIKSSPREVSDEDVNIVVKDMEHHHKAVKQLAELDSAERERFIKTGPKLGLPKYIKLDSEMKVERIEKVGKELLNYGTSTYVSTIRNQKDRMRAFKLLQKMTEHLEQELIAIQERTWFKTGHLAGDDTDG
jgi:ParB family chromosome partitioning protein